MVTLSGASWLRCDILGAVGSLRLQMSQALVDLAPLVPAGTRMVIVHGVATSTRQRLASLLPEATVHDLTDLADLADTAGTSGRAGAEPPVGADVAAGAGPVHGAGPVRGAEATAGAGLAAGADLAVMEVASHVGQARIAAELLKLAYHLREGAVLLVVTARRLGSARQLNTLEGMFGAAEVAQRSGSAVVLRAVRGPEVRATADATAAAPTVEAHLLGYDLRFTTGAGLFSKSRIDDGTRLLIEALPPDHNWLDVLDLGCGYGPIGVAVASRWPQVRVAMADIDPAAVSAARTNAGLNGVGERCQAHLSDGTSALADRRFDAVLSHLPTHVPKSTLARLIDESANVLRPGGELIAVTASAVDLRDRIASTFGAVEVLAESQAGTTPPYRVVHAVKTEQPRR
ncbi:MAG: class I SAM-dependent methyltransferase [Acidimicrobiaceae bacterium]|nr:class I SAM-dependent methyltransferase [Acidimicrobiaceae bacterium]